MNFFGPKRPPLKQGMPKIVITGGLGFIFSHVTEYFVEKGWNVVVIDNLSEGSHPEIVNGTFVHHNVHMAEQKVIDLIVAEEPDYIIHAAAITDVDYSVREPERTLRKNNLGNIHAFEAARRLPKLKKLMYVSTDEVYGECDHRMREDEMMAPKNPYSCSKALGSLLRVTYDNTYFGADCKTVETRFCNVFGPRQAPEKIFAAIKKSIEEGYSIPLHEEGKGYREYIYVKNIPPAIDLLLEKGAGIYNVTLNDGYIVKDLIAKAQEVTGKPVMTHPSARAGMDLKYQMDAAKIEALGWKPLYTFEEGVKEYLLGSK